ncbi:MAG: MBL fold metallo-hydrolase [Halobacteria archaeon]
MEITEVTRNAETFTCNAYLAVGIRNSLVDVGTSPTIYDVIDEHVDTVDDVFLTHKHGDHVGELDEVIERYDPDVYMFDVDDRATSGLRDGDEVDIGGETHRCLSTPGHSDDHIVFYNDERIFSGDVVVYNDDAYRDGSFGRTDMANQSRDLLIQSIEKIEKNLPETVESMYPGHGDVFRSTEEDSVNDVVERALGRAEERQPKYG